MLTIAYDWDGVILIFTTLLILQTSAHAPLPEYSPIILHDNARPHTAGVVSEFFNRLGCEVLYHPSYSPDTSPCDYDLIPKITASLQGIPFCTVNDVLQATDHSLRNLQRLGTHSGIRRLPHRWKRVLHNGGDYFERLQTYNLYT